MLDECLNMRLAIVTWEDIVGVTHQVLPQCDTDLEQWQLIKQTIGYVFEFTNYLVVVTDYDVTHKGASYRHNDYTLIPRGVVISVHDLEEIGVPDPDLPTDDTVARD